MSSRGLAVAGGSRRRAPQGAVPVAGPRAGREWAEARSSRDRPGAAPEHPQATCGPAGHPAGTCPAHRAGRPGSRRSRSRLQRVAGSPRAPRAHRLRPDGAANRSADLPETLRDQPPFPVAWQSSTPAAERAQGVGRTRCRPGPGRRYPLRRKGFCSCGPPCGKGVEDGRHGCGHPGSTCGEGVDGGPSEWSATTPWRGLGGHTLGWAPCTRCWGCPTSSTGPVAAW
jgi:hypothetical protein